MQKENNEKKIWLTKGKWHMQGFH